LVKVHPQLILASVIKAELSEGVGLLVVSELIGGAYFAVRKEARVHGNYRRDSMLSQRGRSNRPCIYVPA